MFVSARGQVYIDLFGTIFFLIRVPDALPLPWPLFYMPTAVGEMR